MKRVILLCVIGVLFAVAGCIDYQETITLNTDGSGSIVIRYALDKATLEQAEEFGDSVSSESDDDSDELPSEAEIREQIKTVNSSVKLVSYEETETEEWRVWNMEFTFDKLSDFDQLGGALAGEQEADSSNEPQRSYAKQPDDTWVFSHSLGGSGDTGGFQFEEGAQETDTPSDSEYAEAMRQMQEAMSEYSEESEGEGEAEEMAEADSAMEEFAKGMEMMFSSAAEAKLTLTVHFPGKIVESNATRVDGNTAVWEASLFDMPPEMTAKVEH